MKPVESNLDDSIDISTPLGAPGATFRELLSKKIDEVRPTIKLDKTFHRQGRRFNDSKYISYAIITTVIMAFKERRDGKTVSDMAHLDFDEYRIASGQYNSIINQMLEISARNDYTVEIDPNLN